MVGWVVELAHEGSWCQRPWRRQRADGAGIESSCFIMPRQYSWRYSVVDTQCRDGSRETASRDLGRLLRTGLAHGISTPNGVRLCVSHAGTEAENISTLYLVSK